MEQGRGLCETCAETNAAAFNTSGCTVRDVWDEFCPPFEPPSQNCDAVADSLCGSMSSRIANEAKCIQCVMEHNASLMAAGCPTDGFPHYNYSINLCRAPKSNPLVPWRTSMAIVERTITTGETSPRSAASDCYVASARSG